MWLNGSSFHQIEFSVLLFDAFFRKQVRQYVQNFFFGYRQGMNHFLWGVGMSVQQVFYIGGNVFVFTFFNPDVCFSRHTSHCPQLCSLFSPK